MAPERRRNAVGPDMSLDGQGGAVQGRLMMPTAGK